MKEIIINTDEQKNKYILLVNNGKLVEKYEETEDIKRLEGNIYIGKVQNVLQGMQAAFIDIGEEKNTFIHIKDVLPKVDSKNENIDEIIKKSNIKEVIKPGKELIVQVKRDSTNKKGARVSTHINLPGKYCVYMPEANFVTISQKIEDKKERERLLKIIKENQPNNCGIIIRTSAEGKKEEDIIKDLKILEKKWENIIKIVEDLQDSSPKMIYKNLGIVERILNDLVEQDIQRIIVNDEKQYEQIKKETKEKVEVLYKRENLLELYDLNQQLEKISNRKIWLKCGGFITIDKTEALTAIDVNSGKYIGTKNLEQTVFTVNKEASIEIAKQIRLRDIGGIIIIDYIDMKEEEHKQKIIDILKENLKQDRSKTQIVGFTKLNLLEMTRKHMCSND
ncbi:MAG: Rne/Rng family ribonuclease [Clostridia bacterium]|nr:Rne/Rng family ribonuclease [Clostridia bacterium]